MKVLVTGASGFIGRHLVPNLRARGHEVTALVRAPDAARKYPWLSNVETRVFDIQRDEPTTLHGLSDHQSLVHLAWPGLPNYSAPFHYEENLPSAYRFLKGIVGGGVHQVLVTGTCLEYGMQDGRLSEDMPTLPTNAYALAKDALHRWLNLLQREKPFVLQWARLFYMYGEGQNPNSLMGQLRRAIQEGAPSFDMSMGEQLRDYLPVEEVADRLARILERPECTGAINVCRGEPISVRRLVEQEIARLNSDIQLNLGRYPYPDYEPMAFWGDAGKFLKHC